MECSGCPNVPTLRPLNNTNGPGIVLRCLSSNAIWRLSDKLIHWYQLLTTYRLSQVKNKEQRTKDIRDALERE